MASKLFTAGQIGTLTLPNRVIRSATQDPFGRRDGTCAPEQVELYREIAAAGTGAIITAYSYISPEARSTGIQVGFATPEQRASQKEVLDAAHAAGGRLILQLMHAGMNVFMPEKHVAGGQAAGPSGGMKAPQRNGNHGDHRGGSGKKSATTLWTQPRPPRRWGLTASSSTAPTATSSANSWTPTPTTAPTNSAAVRRIGSASPGNVSPPSARPWARTIPSW